MPVALRRVVLVALVAGHAGYLRTAALRARLAETGFTDAAGYTWAPHSPSAERAQRNAQLALVFDGLRLLAVLFALALPRRRTWAASAAWSLLLVVELGALDAGAAYVPQQWHAVLVPAWLSSAPVGWAAPRAAALGACALALAVVLWRVPFGYSPDLSLVPQAPWQPIAAACLAGPLLAAAGVALRRAVPAVVGASALVFATTALGVPFGLVPLAAAALAVTAGAGRAAG